MGFALEQPREEVRREGNVIQLRGREEAGMGLKELERAVTEALKRLIDANSKDEPASAKLFAIGAKLNGAKSDEEKRELTAQLDAANQYRREVWNEIREVRDVHAKAKAAYEAAKEGLEKGELEEESVEHRKAA